MRRIAVLDAPSNLGLRPPTATSVPGCAKAPGALRDHGLLTKLGARDAGCLTPPRYDPGDWRPGDGVAQAEQIAAYSRRLADRIGAILDAGEFPVILGGDCSILLGSGLAMHRLGEAVGGRIGLVFVDGHSDFRHPGNASYVGAAAGEDLALVTGRGQADLASIEGRRPYFRDIDVVVLGLRAQDEYRLDLQAAGIVTRPVPALRVEGAARSAQWARDQLVDCAGYWLHVDVDVLDPAVMPAVDAPTPGGIAFPELEILLAGLVESPHCLGVEITVFDPDYDPDGAYAAEIATTVAAGLAAARKVALRPDLIAARADLAKPTRGAGLGQSTPEVGLAQPAPEVGLAQSTPETRLAQPSPESGLAQPESEPGLAQPAPEAETQVAPEPALLRAPAEEADAGSAAEAGSATVVGSEFAADGDSSAGSDSAADADSSVGSDSAADGGSSARAGSPADAAEDVLSMRPAVSDAAAGLASLLRPSAAAGAGERAPLLRPTGDVAASVRASLLRPRAKSDRGGRSSLLRRPVDGDLDVTASRPADVVTARAASLLRPAVGADDVAEVPAANEQRVEDESGPDDKSEISVLSDEAEAAVEVVPEAEADRADEPEADRTGEPEADRIDESEADRIEESEADVPTEGDLGRRRRLDDSFIARPLGQAPLLDSTPLPATRPGMLRPRPVDDHPAEDSFSLPAQRPAFDLGSGSPADIA